MCIPHGASGSKSNGYIKTTSKKSVKRVSQDIFEKGDPDFIDERIVKEEPISIQTLCDRIFGSSK